MGQTPRRKTDRDHTINIAPNLLDRGFTADRPNQKRAGDISQIWTREGWLYLAVILDLHSRRGIGWATSDRRKRDLAIRALRIVIALPSSPCRHRSGVTALGLHLPQQSRQPIPFARRPQDPARTWPAVVEAARAIAMTTPRFSVGKTVPGLFSDPPHPLQDDQGRTGLAQVLGNSPTSRDGHLPIHQRLP